MLRTDYLNGAVRETALQSLCSAVHELPYKRILLHHDATKRGFGKPEMIALAESYANCSGLAAAPAAFADEADDEWHTEL